ncbi:MAG TPA: hypothetical protein VKK79_05800, partial [Candidatus Lokiarchaeia archaeon]|nr:hypothetical protein [Candidatus Lokiarchaeia archaeon]
LIRFKLELKGVHASYVKITEALRDIELTKISPTPNAEPIISLNRTTGLPAKIAKALGLASLIR